MLREQHLRKVEECLAGAMDAARIAGLSGKELQEMLKVLLEQAEERI